MHLSMLALVHFLLYFATIVKSLGKTPAVIGLHGVKAPSARHFAKGGLWGHRGSCLRLASLGAVLVLAFGAAPLFAESAVLLVVDKDLGQPMEGAEAFAGGTSLGKTGSTGILVLELQGELEIRVRYPGYDDALVKPLPGATVRVELAVTAAIQGEGVTVQKERPRAGEGAGTKAFIPKEELDALGARGLFEDALAAARFAPGVAYSGSFIGSSPSIRGGDHSETAVYLDGVEVMSPYQLSGAVSLFDPRWIDSITVSEGPVSARYGDNLSGAIEISSRPAAGDSLEAALSTTGIDASAERALGSGSGILGAGKITWMELPFALLGQSSHFSQVPLVRDAFAKYECRMGTGTSLETELLFGSDDFGQKDAGGFSISEYSSTVADNWTMLGVCRFRTLVGRSQSLDVSLGGNCGDLDISGDDGEGYSVRERISGGDWQGNITWSLALSDSSGLSAGLGLRQARNDYSEDDSYASSLTQTYDPPTNNLFEAAPFLLWDFDALGHALTGELGLRAELGYLYGEGYSASPGPVLDPRLAARLAPFSQGPLKGLSFEAGAALNSQFSRDSLVYAPAYAEGGDLPRPQRNLLAELGLAYEAQDAWKLSAEGYYKDYWDRFFAYGDFDPSSELFTLRYRGDGIGYAYGLDISLDLKVSSELEASASYSYSMARFENPSNAQTSAFMPELLPMGVWYYPPYQRFHTLRLVAMWRVSGSFELESDAVFATGTPDYRCLMQGFPYDDSARNPATCNWDAKATWRWGGPKGGPKAAWELYIAVQNILAPLLPVDDGKDFENEADFNLGWPIPSLGFSLRL